MAATEHIIYKPCLLGVLSQAKQDPLTGKTAGYPVLSGTYFQNIVHATQMPPFRIPAMPA